MILLNTCLTMPNTPIAGFRIPAEIITLIEEKSKAEGKSKTDVVIELLRIGLGIEANQSDVEHIVEHSVIQRIDAVEQYVEHLSNRLDSVEQSVEQLRSHSHTPTSPDHPIHPSQDAPQEAIEPSQVYQDVVKISSQRHLEGSRTEMPIKTSVEDGLTLQQVCEAYGINYKNFSRNAQLKKQTKLEYLADQTGVKWVQRGKRYVRLS